MSPAQAIHPEDVQKFYEGADLPAQGKSIAIRPSVLLQDGGGLMYLDSLQRWGNISPQIILATITTALVLPISRSC